MSLFSRFEGKGHKLLLAKELGWKQGIKAVAVAAGAAHCPWQTLPHTTRTSFCGNSNRSRCTQRERGRDQLFGNAHCLPSREGKESNGIPGWMCLCKFQKHSDVSAKKLFKCIHRHFCYANDPFRKNQESSGSILTLYLINKNIC